MHARVLVINGVAALVAAFLGGCATTAGDRTSQVSGAIPAEMRSGFLPDYSKLREVPGEKGKLRWIAPDLDRGKYRRFIVDPVESRVPLAYQDKVRPNPEVAAAVTTYFRDALVRELRTRYEVVEKPGAGVARISTAITAIHPTAKQLEAWQYLPVAMVVTGIAEASGARERNVVVYVEGEITDSLNGKLLAEVMQGRVAEEGGVRRIEDITPETVKPVLDFWAKDAVRDMQAVEKGELGPR
jgi:hypothetical protein